MPIVSGAGAVAGGKPCQAVGKTCRALPRPVREMRFNAALRLRAPDWSPRQPLRTDGRRSTMKIEGSNPLRGTAVKRGMAGKGACRTDFADALDGGRDAATSPAGVTATAPIASVDALIAVQSADDPVADRGKAHARAAELLDRLDELRADLLLGRVSRQRLGLLADLVRARRATVDDPKLAEVLDEIDLRAQVELAKLAVEP